MTPTREQITQLVESLLTDQNADTALAPETILFGEGLGLDSLQAAELSAVLEEEFGHDPFSHGVIPQTVGDLYAYYEKKS